jgi:hypothetical protein
VTDPKKELIEAEDRAWAGFRALADRFTVEQSTMVGYQPDWSFKDLLAHVACWDAEAAQALEQMRMDTYTGWDRDEDELNAQFYESCKDLPLDTVWAQLHASRARMLEELDRLPDELLERKNRAWRWFWGSAVSHHDDHVPRLREWLDELEAAG